MWWLWVLGGLVGWLAVAVAVGLILGRGIRLADERAPRPGPLGIVPTADLPVALAAQPAAPARVRRRAIPLPPIGIVLAVAAVLLMTSGYLLRLTGSTGTTADVLSMDAPYSLPRMYVALLFAATFVEESGEALAAVAFLIAVLAGVAPRLVLPGDWALRRAVDAHTLEVPENLPGRTAADGTTAY